jgi:uncharacterized protein (DUF1501 family)
MALASSVESFGLVNAFAQEAEAAATDYRALVCIFLSGGNDCNNTLVSLDQYNGPTGSTTNGYANVRNGAGLAIPQASLLPITPANGGSYGLHPNMPEMQALFGQGKLAIMSNVGPLVEPLTRTTYQNGTGKKPLQLFSHSDQVGEWQSSSANTVIQTGWGGRMADKTAGLNGGSTFPQVVSISGISLFVTAANARPLAIADSGTPLSSVLPLTMTGPTADVNSRRAAFDALRSFDLGGKLVKASADTRSSALQTRQALVSANPAIATTFPNTSLGRQLLQVARLIKLKDDPAINVRRQIFFCQLGGFDTHSNQTSATFMGGQGTLLQQLSQALKAFFDATVELGVQNSVTAFTLSDFGRTLSPSGSGVAGVGSDHGWGSHHFVLGGSVVGGRLYGTYPTLALNGPDDADNRGRWIPTTAVEQYAATLATWYGLSSSDLPAVFPLLNHFATPNLGFLV